MTIINGTSYRVIKELQVGEGRDGEGAISVAVNPQTKMIYVCNNYSGEVFVFNEE